MIPHRRQAVSLGWLALLLALVLAGCGGDAESTPPIDGLARLEPASGTYFGVNLDWGHDSVAAFNERLGAQAAVYVQFVGFPFQQSDLDSMDGFFQQVSDAHGLAVLTLEPRVALDAITPQLADDLATRLADYADDGDIGIFVRFAHEMNGSWYAWSQQPTAYIAAFRTLAAAVHQASPDIAMLWAPSYGAGYPFHGGAYEAQPGSADFALLDTDGDGALSMHDDSYLPYYPGDDAVDWVGLSLYHWGNAYPWGENEIAEPHKFIDEFTGAYNGANGDERDVTDFYATFVGQHHKPMAIVETAALYNPAAGGADELAIKQNWWRQVFDPEVARQFPGIKMINWFEWDKPESEINGARIDWTATADPAIRAAFVADLAARQFLYAPVKP